jgi:ATP-dependent Clp protease protease subunit
VQQLQLPKTVFATFVGQIDQQSLPRLFQSFSLAINAGVQDLHLLFQSPGGMIADGIALYNFFGALPFNLHIYNSGSVQSVAVISYLGATTQFVSKHANFMIHKSHFPSPDRGNAAKLGALAESLMAEDARIEAILKTHTNIPAETWALHALQDVYLTAQQSVDYGIADEIREFDIPHGAQAYNI